METSLDVLATQERELRKRMEEVNNPPDSRSIPAPDVKMAPTKPPAGPNGTAKPKVNGATAKKGKKRKGAVKADAAAEPPAKQKHSSASPAPTLNPSIAAASKAVAESLAIEEAKRKALLQGKLQDTDDD